LVVEPAEQEMKALHTRLSVSKLISPKKLPNQSAKNPVEYPTRLKRTPRVGHPAGFFLLISFCHKLISPRTR
jgi:hypothetical protein